MKESDRITALVTGLRQMGVPPMNGPTGSWWMDARPTGGEVDAAGDHRLVMAFALVALGATGPTTIRALTRSACPTPPSSRISPGWCRDDRQDLPRRLHGERQEHDRPGARVAPRWRAEDVDELIERRERATVAQVFATHGEPYFRSVEREILKVLQPLRHVVVATGGGTFADPDNRAAINLDGVSVWIDVPLADLIPRIPLDGRRPLAANRAELERLHVARVDVPHGAHPHHRIPHQRGGRGRTDSRHAPPAAALLRTLRHDRLTPVRYLVLTDLHANLHALDAVLADARSIGYDQVLVLGDLVGHGGDPGSVIDRTLELKPVALIRGNHDKVAAGLEPATLFNEVARRSIEWTASVLTPGQVKTLVDLPKGPMRVTNDLEIRHGTPFDEDHYVFDGEDAAQAMDAASGRICPLRPHASARRLHDVGRSGVDRRRPRRR